MAKKRPTKQPIFVDRPHDALFQRAMSDQAAAQELVSMLPAELREMIVIESIETTNHHFVSDELRHLYSDCLLKGLLKDGGQVRMYYLLEHLSHPDRMMPFRFLQYQVAAWAHELRSISPTPEKLPLIIPVLIYNGKEPYNYSMDIRDLIDAEKSLVDRLWLQPKLFALSQISDEQLAQSANLGAVLLAMKHAYDEIPFEKVIVQLAKITDRVKQRSFAIAVISYIISVSGDVDPESLADLATQHLGKEIGGEAMTVAEKLFKQGEAKGKAEGKVEGEESASRLFAIRSFQSGLGLEIVHSITGLPKDLLALLKQQAIQGT